MKLKSFVAIVVYADRLDRLKNTPLHPDLATPYLSLCAMLA